MAATTYKKYYKITCDSCSSRFFFRYVLRTRTLSHQRAIHFFSPFLARASSLLGKFTPGFVRLGSVLRMEVLLSGCWSHWSSQTCDIAWRRRDPPPSFTCVSEIYNNRAPLPHTRPVRVVLSWLRGIGRTHLGERCTSPINSLICFEIVAARPGETDRRSRSSEIRDKRNVINVKLSYHARMYTRIHSFVLRAYAYHLLVS